MSPTITTGPSRLIKKECFMSSKYSNVHKLYFLHMSFCPPNNVIPASHLKLVLWEVTSRAGGSQSFTHAPQWRLCPGSWATAALATRSSASTCLASVTHSPWNGSAQSQPLPGDLCEPPQPATLSPALTCTWQVWLQPSAGRKGKEL